jgi:hypothetical protein
MEYKIGTPPHHFPSNMDAFTILEPPAPQNAVTCVIEAALMTDDFNTMITHAS